MQHLGTSGDHQGVWNALGKRHLAGHQGGLRRAGRPEQPSQAARMSTGRARTPQPNHVQNRRAASVPTQAAPIIAGRVSPLRPNQVQNGRAASVPHPGRAHSLRARRHSPGKPRLMGGHLLRASAGNTAFPPMTNLKTACSDSPDQVGLQCDQGHTAKQKTGRPGLPPHTLPRPWQAATKPGGSKSAGPFEELMPKGGIFASKISIMGYSDLVWLSLFPYTCANTPVFCRVISNLAESISCHHEANF